MPSRINSNISNTAEDHERCVRPRLEEYPNIESASPSSQSSMANKSTLIQTHYKPAPFSSHRALAISEILLLIFSHFTDTDLSVVSFTRVAPVAVSQVNHQWRLVALSFSRLWASFGIILNGSFFDGTSLRTAEHDIVNLVLVEKWWNRFLDRSKNANLKVIITTWTVLANGLTCSLENYRIILSIINETILKHGSRLEHLHASILFPRPSGYVQEDTEDICMKDMPRLKFLHLSGFYNLSVDIGKESMPDLAELQYSKVVRYPLQIQVQTQFVTLLAILFGTILEVSQQWINLENILRLSPHLRKLTCCVEISSQSSTIELAKTDLRLQTLQEVQFRLALPGSAHHILDNFELPGVVLLEFELDAELPGAWAGIEALLLRSQAPLTKLIFAHTATAPDVAKSPRVNDDCILSILRAAPHLENVVVRRIDIGDYLRGVLDPVDASVRQRLSILPELRCVDIILEERD
ncbi:hypothetical protein DFH11DRAFT_1547842 [Phellopilus nigrolimitatus]|nr:hypothetical protein DFH11DRAFT_1547842 [Phellopilus nigrolimitatus]